METPAALLAMASIAVCCADTEYSLLEIIIAPWGFRSQYRPLPAALESVSLVGFALALWYVVTMTYALQGWWSNWRQHALRPRILFWAKNAGIFAFSLVTSLVFLLPKPFDLAIVARQLRECWADDRRNCDREDLGRGLTNSSSALWVTLMIGHGAYQIYSDGAREVARFRRRHADGRVHAVDEYRA